MAIEQNIKIAERRLCAYIRSGKGVLSKIAMSWIDWSRRHAYTKDSFMRYDSDSMHDLGVACINHAKTDGAINETQRAMLHRRNGFKHKAIYGETFFKLHVIPKL